MKTLVVFRDAVEAARTGATLRELGHDVDVANERTTACARLLKSLPEVVLIEPNLPLADGLAVIKVLRSITSTYIYVLAASRAMDDDQLRQVYDAGADGEVRALAPADLRARFASIQRQLSRPKSVAKPAALMTTATVPKITAGPDLAAVCDAITAALGTMVAVPATCEAVDPSASFAHAAVISLADAERELALSVVLAAGAESARALTMHMFGESGDELASDMLNELANIAMGATKTALGTAGYALTGSLPRSIAPGEVPTYGGASQSRETVTVVLANARIQVSVMVASAQNVTLTIDKLREGMVLAKDVFNARGVLVLTAKTRLSETSVVRLRGILPASTRIEIAAGGG